MKLTQGVLHQLCLERASETGCGLPQLNELFEGLQYVHISLVNESVTEMLCMRESTRHGDTLCIELLEAFRAFYFLIGALQVPLCRRSCRGGEPTDAKTTATAKAKL